MISEAGDHQCAGGQLPAQAFVDQEGADGAVREPVLELAVARHLLVFDDLPRLAGKFGDSRLALSFGGQRAVAFGLPPPPPLPVALAVARPPRPLPLPRL